MPSPEPKRPWKQRLSSKTVNFYDRWIAKSKSIGIVAVLLVACGAIIGLAQVTGSIATIWRAVRDIFPGTALKIGTGLFVLEVANQPSTSPPELFQEVRHQPTGCRIFRLPIKSSAGGLWASPGDDGARATLLLKLLIANTSGQRLTKVQLLLSPAKIPLEFTTIASTPNVTASMERRQTAQGGAEIYILTMDSIASDDFVVLTLAAKLDRKNAKQVLAGELGMNIFSLRADQLETAKPSIRRYEMHYRDLYLTEGLRTSGKPGFDWNSVIRISNMSEAPTERDFAFLPPARDCPD